MEIITSRRNPMAVHIKKLGTSSSYRREHGEFLCDGDTLLGDAVAAGAAITVVLTSALEPFNLPADTQVFYAEQEIIDSLSPLTSAQDTLFICKMPQVPGISDFLARLGSGDGHFSVMLDSLQDPSNVGAIIRTANALGVSCVILAGHCADPYNPKAVRASMGAIFRQDVRRAGYDELAELRQGGMRFVAAATGADCIDIRGADLRGAVIAIGNEGSGLSREVLELCEMKVTIPLAFGSESLNAAVAAAIIMWEARRHGG
ncbi:MAG: RNA methyltransferase [Oscillospiraceae bacterium]|nr:RNA methyltransferase [Oscillospiraceae bacterium]